MYNGKNGRITADYYKYVTGQNIAPNRAQAFAEVQTSKLSIIKIIKVVHTNRIKQILLDTFRLLLGWLSRMVLFFMFIFYMF